VSNPLRTVEDYELFVYSLPESFVGVQRSTLILVRHGMSLVRVVGELFFADGYRLVVRERLLHSHLPVVIDWYGYEVWREDEKLFWYDSQPHPGEPSLQRTHPHHKHVPPDMKHNRIPAPTMSFKKPNLPVLIEEILHLIRSEQATGE